MTSIPLTLQEVTVRPASLADDAFIARLIPRFVEFGPPAWHDPELLMASFAGDLRAALRDLPAGHALYIAERAGEPLGFIHLELREDAMTGIRHGHVSDLAVAREAEGVGVARTLMAAAETWARRLDLPFLTLAVFSTNVRARRLYASLGYGEDLLRLRKPLGTLKAADRVGAEHSANSGG